MYQKTVNKIKSKPHLWETVCWSTNPLLCVSIYKSVRRRQPSFLMDKRWEKAFHRKCRKVHGHTSNPRDKKYTMLFFASSTVMCVFFLNNMGQINFWNTLMGKESDLTDLVPLIFLFECCFGIRFLKRAKFNTGKVLVSISPSQAGKKKIKFVTLFSLCN